MASEIKLEEPDNTVSLTSSRGPSRITTQKDQTVSVKKGVVVSDDESDEVNKKSKGKNIWVQLGPNEGSGSTQSSPYLTHARTFITTHVVIN